MAHKFNPENISRLDNPEKRKRLPPKEILLKFGLKRGDIFADLGAGSGYFTFPAAKIVGESGYVYALDISEKMLTGFHERLLDLDTCAQANINTLLVNEHDLKLGDSVADFVLASMVLHETLDLRKTIQEVYRILKTGGVFGVIEWNKIQSPFGGPPLHDRLSPHAIIGELNNSGFLKIEYHNIGNYFYSILAIKK